MTESVIAYLTAHGYLAIFTLIFVQELGVPNPVPNEFILLYGGYLAWSGALSFPLAILVGVAADFIGTSVLYAVFYVFGRFIMKKPPRWLHITPERIERLQRMIQRRGRWGIFLGRLIPYARGYTSVGAGLLDIKPRVFLPMVLLSAALWSGGYVILGYALGPRWETAVESIGGTEGIVALVLGILAVILIGRWARKRYRTRHPHIA